MRRLFCIFRRVMDESEWDKYVFMLKNFELSKVLENFFKIFGIIK